MDPLQQTPQDDPSKDPAFVKVAREVARVSASRKDVSPDDINAYVQQELGGKYSGADVQKYLTALKPGQGSPLRNTILNGISPALAAVNAALGNPAARDVARSAGQGLTGNFSDELLGLVPKALGGGEAAKEEMRLRGELFHKANPIADNAANIAGGIASSALLPELKLPGLTRAVGAVPASMLKGGAVGGVLGAASGAGAGEGPQRADNAIMGGGVGAVLGTTIPAVMGIAKYIGNPERRALARLISARDATVYKDPATGKTLRGEAALRAKLNEYTSAGRGSEATVADLSPNLGQTADFVGNNDEESYVKLAKLIGARRADVSDRLLQDVKANTGGAAPADLAGNTDATARAAELTSSKRTWAGGPEGYGGMRTTYPEVPNTKIAQSPDLQDKIALLDQVKAAVGPSPSAPVAAKIAALEAEIARDQIAPEILTHPKVRSALAAAKTEGLIPEVPTPAEVPTLDKMMSLKGRVEDMRDAAFRSGKNNLGFALKDAAQTIDTHLAENIPEYAKVKGEYAMRSGLEDALSKGQEAYRAQDSRGMQEAFDKLSGPQKVEFRRGMVSEVIADLRAGKKLEVFPDIATGGVKGKSPLINDKLKIAFGSKTNFQDFMRRAMAEQDLGKLANAVGNSSTARRLAAASVDPLDVMLQQQSTMLATNVKGMSKSIPVRVLSRLARTQAARNTAQHLAPMLMAQGPGNINAVLARLNNGVGIPPWVSTTAPAVGGMTLPNLFGITRSQ